MPMNCGTVVIQIVPHGDFKRIAPTGLYRGTRICVVESLASVGTIDAISIDVVFIDFEVVLKIDTFQ